MKKERYEPLNISYAQVINRILTEDNNMNQLKLYEINHCNELLAEDSKGINQYLAIVSAREKIKRALAAMQEFQNKLRVKK